MAMDTTKVVLPRSVATYIKDNTKGHSTIAALSPAQPQLFADADHLVFDGASEAEVVGEGQVKSSYEQPVTNLVGRRFKVQTTTRVTNELQWADEDNQLEIIQAIQADQVAALGRVLDYVVYHAFNPKPKAELEGFAKLSEAAEHAEWASCVMVERGAAPDCIVWATLREAGWPASAATA